MPAPASQAGFSGRLAPARPPTLTPTTTTPAALVATGAATAPPLHGRRRRALYCTAAPIDQAATAAAAAQAAAASAAPPPPAAAAAQPGQPPSALLLPQLKAELRDALAGLDRGIFGAPAPCRERADLAARALEAANPTPAPLTERMDLVAGEWRLLYTTVTIAGVRKTKLGLREFVRLGAFAQRIDPSTREAVNEIGFGVSGLGAALSGALTVRATYEVVSPTRVAIAFAGASLAPSALEALFRANYDLLLSIFNPQGWLDVTYVDEELRIGRDDKGHLFVLERCGGSAGSDRGGPAAEGGA